MKARGKRRAKRGASPLGKNKQAREALKERNNQRWYFALSVLAQSDFDKPGATRFPALSACPWLLYFAPLAL
jgi:hypothetical protein